MTEEERIRYSRLIAIDEIGKEGMEKLRNSTVLIVGCGALGSMVAMQLAASGIGRLKIVDFDTIDLSNLQRQLFFNTSETGESKAYVLKKRIQDLNPGTIVELEEKMLTSTTGPSLIEGCDFVVEATDNPSSMLLIDRICEEKEISCVMAGVNGFGGQVLTCIPRGRRYSDIFPETEQSGLLPCSISGVLGPAAAIAASIEAAETIKSITGVGQLLSDKILTFDLQNNHFAFFNT